MPIAVMGNVVVPGSDGQDNKLRKQDGQRR